MKRTLPRELDDLSGMRAARWFRESTAGQWDNFGPDAQREQQDRAIERYGLVDAGLEWSVASSGWTSAWRTATWETMIGSATGRCLRRPRRRATSAASCATSSRRSSRSRTISMPPGSSSSSPTSGCSPRTRAPGTSSSARPMRPRPTAASFASASARATPPSGGRLGVPGGNKMPYGLIREGKPSVLRVDEEQAAVVIRAYQLAASGSTDWEVAAQTGLAKTHVGEVLTNPIYAGRLRTGEPAAIAPIVDPSLWSTVQTRRERRRTRTPGRIVKGRLRPAPLLRRLREVPLRRRRAVPASAADVRGVPGGQAGRPPSACPATARAIDTRIKGHSYPQDVVRGRGGELLGKVGEPRRRGHDRGRRGSTARDSRSPTS